MSQETIEYLNSGAILIGNTDQRDNAWWKRADDSGAEPNHYPGFIPVADVRRRLFSWSADETKVAIEIPSNLEHMTHMDDDGRPMQWVVQADLKAFYRSDKLNRLGIFKTGYLGHQYDEWLLQVSSNILGDSLGISSAGLLREGAIAWVEISVPDTIRTPEGVAFRPNLLATTSFDGSIATTYKRTVTDTVCDNTRAMALAEKGQQYKVRHSKYSKLRLDDARDALAMVHAAADDFAAEIRELCATTVTDAEWFKFLDAWVPTKDEKGKPLTGRSLTLADTKRSKLKSLYDHDDRVTPWKGTAHGVLQAVNTFEHHEGRIKGGEAARAERNMLRTVLGDWDSLDAAAWATLDKVLVASN